METGRFPNRLKLFRRRKGYSCKKIAKVLGFADTNAIYRWEKGERMPNAFQLFQLATIYEALPHDLYDELWLELHTDESLLISSEFFNNNQEFYM